MGKVIYEASESDQFFTPLWLRELAWNLLGTIDLDPCTSRRNPMKARHFYTTRALQRPWEPARTLWLNAPYGREVPDWLRLFGRCMRRDRRREGLALLPARPGARWYVEHTADSQAFCELHGRVTYEHPDGTPCEHPARWASILMYYGPRRARFARMVRAFGVVRLCRKAPRPPPLADVRQLDWVRAEEDRTAGEG